MCLTAKDYKFLVSFENADCDDYISEKLFKTIETVSTIMIVRIVKLSERNVFKLGFIACRQMLSPLYWVGELSILRMRLPGRTYRQMRSLHHENWLHIFIFWTRMTIYTTGDTFVPWRHILTCALTQGWALLQSS